MALIRPASCEKFRNTFVDFTGPSGRSVSSVSAKAMDSGGGNDGWWSDEEWRQWRLQQSSASGKQGGDPDKKLSMKQEYIRHKDNFVQKQLADAAALLERAGGQSSSSSGGPGAIKFQMPSEWSVTVFNADERDRNAQKKRQSFADIGRLCNNRLKAMYQVWQSEAAALKLQSGVGQRAAVTLVTQEKIDSLQKTGEQQAKIEALESELKKLRNEIKEKDYKLLATEKVKDNVKKECEDKVNEMSALFQRKLDSQKEWRAKALHSITCWKQRCGNLERRLALKKALLANRKLEDELAKDSQFVVV